MAEHARELDVAATTAELLRLDGAAGARHAAPEALRAVRAARRLLRTPAGAADRESLAELFEVAGWILFDAERHGPSYALNRQALALARGLPPERRSIEWLVLSVLCMQQAHLGRPGDALRISSSVLAGRELPERVAAIFHVREARAHALLQRRREAVRSMSAARELLGDGPSTARDPSWTWWFDRSELVGHEGLALADLGDLEAAASCLHEAAGAGDAPAYRALFSAELASALSRAGAWREADAWLSTLVESAPGMGSARALNSLVGATRIIGRGRGVPRGLRDTSRYLAEVLRKEIPFHGPRRR
ncbi:DNA-binding protein [Streptomyces sp. ISL-94]|uniref:DNA-binding protein n=1 Tax=Streptomyces sp. ISL-94 TaxID=2819190 RepID=UPI001BE801F2|nr:DNA-binding protein [Streptomyces sp. ISL-94]MBT2482436.1 DNA-binding protein [Streptomyces sp. ISL-94]